MRRLIEGFDQVRIISLPERTDRRRAVLNELNRIGISELGPKISFFDALRPPPAAPGEPQPNGALLSHREAIRAAIRSGAQNLLILEDDIFFLQPEDARIDAVRAALARDPWDVIYFGYLEPTECALGEGPLAEWSGKVIGGHFCGMNRRFMERIVAFMDGFGRPDAMGEVINPTHRDGAFNIFVDKNQDIRRVLVRPCLAVQRSSRTDLHKNRFFDRTPILREIAGAMRELNNHLKKRG